MMEVGLARVSRIIPLMLIAVFLCPFAIGKTIYVDDGAGADYESIQAGIDAAENGDTVSVAPGIYYENVVLKDGVNLSGTGVDVTIIDANGYGDVVDARANDVTISGFTLRNSGQFDLGHMNCGVFISGSYVPVIRNNVIAYNRIGIGLWDGAHPDIRNNIIKYNDNGFYIYGTEEHPSNPAIINNTIVNNEIDGIMLRVMVSPVIVNNIITGHAYGINQNYVTGAPIIHHNNLWNNHVNYLRDNSPDDTLAGPGSISADPYFVDPGYWADANDSDAVCVGGDCHLNSQAGRWDPNNGSWIQDDVTSPCIDAGDPNSPIGHEPFPNGGIINMGAYGGTYEAGKSPSGLHAKYGGGTGEPNNPYLIYTAEQMNTIGLHEEDWDKRFKLMADINLSGYTGTDFNIIGYWVDWSSPDNKPFAGVFNGNGYTISNFTCTFKDTDRIGLFGYVDGNNAQIKDLGLIDPNIDARIDVGSLVGRIEKGTINNCYIQSGSVMGNDRVGGLVGYNLGTITNCYVNANVMGGDYIGGLVGYNREYSQIFGCYSTGRISGREDVGGLVGINRGIITNCYTINSVSGSKIVGGFAGSNGWPPLPMSRPYPPGDITNCYSAGSVSGNYHIGGLVGRQGYGSVTTSFWDIETSGWTTSDGGTGKTTVEIQTAGTFLEAGWDFVDETANGTEDIWWILEGQDYPKLWWELIGD